MSVRKDPHSSERGQDLSDPRSCPEVLGKPCTMVAGGALLPEGANEARKAPDR